MVCVCLKSICLLSMCVFAWGGFGRLLEGYGWACLYVCLKGYVLMGLRHDDAVLPGRKGKWWEKVDFTLPGKLRFHLEASRRGYISAIGNCLCHELGLLCVCVCVCVCFSHTHVYVYTYMNFVWMAFLHKSMQFVLPELPHFSLSPSAKFRIFLWNQQTTFSVEFSYEGDWINLCVKTYSLLLEYILKHLCFERTLKCGFWIHGRCPRCHRRKETQLPVTVEVGNFS